MDRRTSDFTLSCYTSNLWIKQIIALRQTEGKFYYSRKNRHVYVRFITLFGNVLEFRHIAEKCLLYSVDDGTGVIQCRYNVNLKDVDELEDWDWKDFNTSKNDEFGETSREKSNVEDDTIFNDATIQPEDKLANRNSRFKVLDSLRWSIINSFRSHETIQVGDNVCIHGRVYSFLGNIQIHVNIIRPITMIEELTLITAKLDDCGLLSETTRGPSTSQVNTQIFGSKRKRPSGLMTFDTLEETQLRAKPRMDPSLPPSPRIVPGSLSFPSSVDSGVTFDTMIPEEESGSSDDDMFIPATP